MSRPPVTIFYDPQQLIAEEARRLSVDHYVQPELANVLDNQTFQHLGKHRMVVGSVEIAKKADLTDYDEGTKHTVNCISASAPIVSAASPKEYSKYAENIAAYKYDQRALFQRIIANTQTTELVLPAFGLDDKHLDGLSQQQRTQYRKMAIRFWLAVWRKHLESNAEPTQLTFVIPSERPLSQGNQQALDFLTEEIADIPSAKIERGNIIDYCVEDKANRTLVNQSSSRAIGGEYQSENGLEEQLAKRSDLLKRHVDGPSVKTQAFDDVLQSSKLLAVAYRAKAPNASGAGGYPAQENYAYALYTITGEDGELRVALGKANDAASLRLPTKAFNVGRESQARNVAVAVLQETTSAGLQAADFVFSGAPAIKPPIKSSASNPGEAAKQCFYLRHHNPEVQSSADVQLMEGQLKPNPPADATVKFLKVSEVISAYEDSNEVNKHLVVEPLREMLEAHQRSQTFLKEAWEKEKSTPVSMSNFEIIATSGSKKADCLGAAFIESLLVLARYGHAGEKHYFETHKKRFKPFFDALKEQAADVKQLYSDLPVTTVVEEDRVKDFAALDQLSTKERQARFGAAIRKVFADLLQTELTTVAEPTNRIYGNQLFEILAGDFDEYLKNTRFHPNDVFENMDFITRKFADLKARLNDEPAPSVEALKSELEDWWHNHGGYGDYIAQVRTPGTYLGAMAANVLSTQFGVKLRYKYQSEDKDRGANELSDNDDVNRPTVRIHFNGTDHWSALVSKKKRAAVNKKRDKNGQLIVSEPLSKQEIVAYKERRANEVVTMSTQINNFEEFATNVSQFYSASHTPEEYPYEVTNPEYYKDFDVGSKTLEIEGGIKLKFSSGSQGIGAGTEEETGSLNAELVVRAVDPEGEHTLSEADLKEMKLKGIARFIANAFMANGMPKDNLQINITRVGKLWASDRKAIIEAYKAAGFKRIQFNGKDAYNAVREEQEREEIAQETSDSIMRAGPIVKLPSSPEEAVKSAKDMVADNPIESGLIAGGAALALAGYMTGRLSPTVALGLAATGALGGAAYKLYRSNLLETGLMQLSQLKDRAWMSIPEKRQAVDLIVGGLSGLGLSALSGKVASYIVRRLVADGGKIGDIASSVFTISLLPKLTAWINQFVDEIPYGSFITKNAAKNMMGLSVPFGMIYSGGLSFTSLMAVYQLYQTWGKWLLNHEETTLGGHKPSQVDIVKDRKLFISKERDGSYTFCYTKVEQKQIDMLSLMKGERPEPPVYKYHESVIQSDAQDPLEKELLAALQKQPPDFIGEPVDKYNYKLKQLIKIYVRKHNGVIGKMPESTAKTLQSITAAPGLLLGMAKGQVEAQWNGLSGRSQVITASALALLSAYLFATTGEWLSPEFSIYSFVLPFAAGIMTKQSGASYTKSLLTFSGALLGQQLLTSTASFVWAWTIGKGPVHSRLFGSKQPQVETNNNHQSSVKIEELTDDDVGTFTDTVHQQPKVELVETADSPNAEGLTHVKEGDQHTPVIEPTDQQSITRRSSAEQPAARAHGDVSFFRPQRLDTPLGEVDCVGREKVATGMFVACCSHLATGASTCLNVAKDTLTNPFALATIGGAIIDSAMGNTSLVLSSNPGSNDTIGFGGETNSTNAEQGFAGYGYMMMFLLMTLYQYVSMIFNVDNSNNLNP